MFVWLVVVLFSLCLVLVLYGAMFVLSVKNLGIYKVVSFESGFKGVGKVHVSFSVHFFLLMLMFVVFDLEVIFLLSLVIVDSVGFLVFLVVFVFVLGGFFLEWFYGKLVWVV